MRTENEPTGRSSAPPSAAAGARPTTPRPRLSGRLRATGAAALAVHLAMVAWVVLRPLPVTWVYDTNLTPFGSVRRALALGEASGLWQIACELLLLAPVGVLLPLAGGRLRTPWLLSFLQVTGVSVLLATGLEVLSSWAPGHVLDVDHILLAVLGASCTHLLVVPAGRALLRGRPARVRVPAPVPAADRTPADRAPGAVRPPSAPLPGYGRPAPRAR
ncbi:VanZ family protein [Kitasatospora sp. NPDC057223]|uniref:VanZ family protein n=1 Tax=Kitasatospora sp. NPDC057223 TaxID=3346055 RepID=UPI00363BCEA5